MSVVFYFNINNNKMNKCDCEKREQGKKTFCGICGGAAKTLCTKCNVCTSSKHVEKQKVEQPKIVKKDKSEMIKCNVCDTITYSTLDYYCYNEQHSTNRREKQFIEQNKKYCKIHIFEFKKCFDCGEQLFCDACQECHSNKHKLCDDCGTKLIYCKACDTLTFCHEGQHCCNVDHKINWKDYISFRKENQLNEQNKKYCLIHIMEFKKCNGCHMQTYCSICKRCQSNKSCPHYD